MVISPKDNDVVKLDNITTGGGDFGETSLGDGQRVNKSDIIFTAIGDADEINCQIGLLITVLGEAHASVTDLYYIQHDLFDLGADLCMPISSKKGDKALRICEAHIKRIEELKIKYSKDLEMLNSFILPGGSMQAAQAHIARAQIRRFERHIVAASLQYDINPMILIYVNRLSDFLFQFARYLNDKGLSDILWQPAYSIKSNNA